MDKTNTVTIAEIRKMVSGYARTQELYTTVKLGIPDQLAAGPMTAEEMASNIDAHSKGLYRFLRLLVARGFVNQEPDNRFSLTESGELLRSDHPDSITDLITYTGEFSYRAGLGMYQSIKKGEAGFDRIFGEPFFAYLDHTPSLRKLFDKLSGANAIERAISIVDAYDFSGNDTIVDVAGGNGTLITAILKANPASFGIVFEAPNVVDETKRFLIENNLENRSQVVSGNFFLNKIPEGDILILSNIIHDWNDPDAINILRNCRSSMGLKSKLLIIEQIMPDLVADGTAVVGSDITMLMLLNGAERTKDEYTSLLRDANLEINGILPFSPWKTIEGRKPNWAIIECVTGDTEA
ncbi:hypothetical protein KQH62_03310 [bacterium]|nr:hypothetical protein [bacterium]